MIGKLLVLLMWLYWKINRPFLAAWGVAVLGHEAGDLKVNGRVVVRRIEDFLHKLEQTVFVTFMGAIITLPLAVPVRMPYSPWRRKLLKIWLVVRSNVGRIAFVLKGRDARAAQVDAVFRRLAAQAPEQLDDLVKTIVSLRIVKGVFAAAYLDEATTWAAIQYDPMLRGVPEPPSGPVLVDPPRTASGALLHDKRVSVEHVAGLGRHDGRTYCVIGSGAGGGVAAYSIQEQDPGARVILLETGPLITNDQFKTTLLDSAARAYMNAALTLSADQLFTFRQGRCVGGSTVLNNSVAIKPTGFWWDTNIVQRWQDGGIELDWERLYRTYDEVSPLVNVAELDDGLISKAARTLKAGFERTARLLAVHRVPVNVRNCTGCGRCNIGCQYDAKRSLMTTLIPELVRKGGMLVPEAKVNRILFDGQRSEHMRVTGIEVSDARGHNYTIHADRFVLSAGAFASSKLLWRSGFVGAEPGVRTVGKRFSVNLGSPVIGAFPDRQDALHGQQVGYVVEVPDSRMIIETAFAPPGAIGMMVPMWGPAFLRALERVNYMAAAVPVVSSLSYGEIRRGFLGDSGFVIDFAMIDEDWRRLEHGMVLTANAMFDMGATEIFVNRFDGRTLTRREDIPRYFSGIGPADFISVESAHMQGGNVIGRAPHLGVVDSQLKVYGVENLWICDASVIPAPITVNIALTVMALARYAAPFVVQG